MSDQLRKAEIEAAYNHVIYGTRKSLAKKNAAEKYDVNVNSIGNGTDLHIMLCDMSLRHTQTSALIVSIENGDFFEFLQKYAENHIPKNKKIA